MGKEINWIEHRGRVYLKDVLPLDTPFKIEIEPTSACNFKCIYCRHSSVKIKPEFMSMEIFDKIISDIKKFPNKIKTFNFVGIGEPLLNKNIYEMILKAKEVSNDVVLITNGSLLTRENSNKLIATGIKTIRVSLQGINEGDYLDICGYKINFNEFLSNLEYLYKNKSESTKLYLKMPDIAINTKKRKELFYELFKNKCDYLVIQNITNNWEEVDFSFIKQNEKNVIGSKNKKIDICYFPFYTMSVDKQGVVFPCCHTYGDISLGNVINDNIFDIWRGTKLNKFRINLLSKFKDNINNTCKNCLIPYSYYNKWDDLDDYKEYLLKKYIIED